MLTIKQIEAAKPREKAYKLADQGGLYLWITPTAKSWRVKYRIARKEKTLSLGQYPGVGLAEARERQAEARKLVGSGADPSAEKRKARQAARLGAQNTVRALGEEWFAEHVAHRSRSWVAQNRRFLDHHLYPAWDSRPIESITPADVLELTKGIARTRPSKAALVQQLCTRLFAYAVRHMKIKHNPARELSGTIIAAPTVHYRALDPQMLPAFVSALAAYAGRSLTTLGIRILLLTVTRKCELLNARWSEFELEAATWLIPAARMQCRREHIVPLAPQVVEALRQLKPLTFGSEFVLPHRSKPLQPMHTTTLNYAFASMGIDADPHGMRACFSTWANEHGYRSDVIEACLAHAERNQVRGAYNRTMYWPERRKLMQAWADHVDGVSKPQTNVASIEDHRKRA